MKGGLRKEEDSLEGNWTGGGGEWAVDSSTAGVPKLPASGNGPARIARYYPAVYSIEYILTVDFIEI